MWRARERWISADRDPAPSFPIMEWWDGTKAKEIAWFFDSHCEFELPVVCQSCYEVYQAHPIKCEELSDEFNFSQDSQAYEFACSSCGDWICADRKTTKGDPRNITIMGYWDGFQSSTTVLRSTWVVGIKFLNAGSNSKIPPMPVLFIPNSTDESTSQLDILDAALEPFIRECVDLFVNGIHVDYAYPTELVDALTSLSRSSTLRCMLVMFSGDHPAQCKFAGFSTGGLTGCMRYECLSRWKSRPGIGLGGIVEYHDNRKCYRYPPRARSIQLLQEAAMEIARCESAAQRKEVTRRSGMVAKTRAWRLVKGVGLDLSRDLTFDSMHVLALCLFKKYIELLRKGAASSPQSKTALSRAMVEVTTAKPSSITGRWPKDIFNRLGYFKAEECSKFIIYCVPHILHELGYHTGSALYQLGLLLIQIARMFYLLHRSGDGWTADSLDRCRFALASWRIRSEELLGPNSSILEHVAGAGHMVDDIIRHGPSNVYWSYGFERLVAGYNKVKTNNRNMEHSFTFHYARVLFAKCMVQIWEDDDGLLPHERAVRLLHSHMRFSTSRLSERTLKDECQPWHSEGVCVVLRTGIGIGSKRSKVCTIHRGLKVYLTRFWRESEATSRGEEIPEISDRIVQLKTVLIRGKVFKPGDHVIVLDETRADLAYEWNWKGRIVSCFYHSCGNKTQMFFEFRWLYNKTESNVQIVDPISGMQLLHPTERSHVYENWRPAMQVAYHFFPIRRHRDGDILALETEE
ncbi:hypothetical protein R1sor_017011 [Riccia sorocarpa]|uniref:Uncharacterized protein n=1 Tax=Riccia sorocarpa TaxID=122646 RepID=A0ABD3IBR9_9MARC